MFNFIKSGLLIIFMTLLMMFIGGLVGGRNGALLFFAVSMIFNFLSYFFSDKITLMAYRAKKANPEQFQWLYQIVEDLSNRAELPKIPDLYIIPMNIPNAFATGRSPKKAVVAVTTALLDDLSREEIAAVIAHELGHVKHWDILIQTIVASMASAIMWISYIARWGAIFGGRDDDNVGILQLFFIAILAPLAATLVQLGISRSREYLADDYSAKIIGSGEPLINALLVLNDESRILRTNNEISPSTAHMFIYPSTINGFLQIFSTHPSLENRIANLRRQK